MFCFPLVWCLNCPLSQPAEVFRGLCLTSIVFGLHSPSCSFSTLSVCSLEESRPVSEIAESSIAPRLVVSATSHAPLPSPPSGDEAATLTSSPWPCSFCWISSNTHLLWRQIPHSLLYVVPSVPQTGFKFLGQATQTVPSLLMPLEYWLQSTCKSSTESAPTLAPSCKEVPMQPPTTTATASAAPARR